MIANDCDNPKNKLESIARLDSTTKNHIAKAIKPGPAIVVTAKVIRDGLSMLTAPPTPPRNQEIHDTIVAHTVNINTSVSAACGCSPTEQRKPSESCEDKPPRHYWNQDRNICNQETFVKKTLPKTGM